MMRSAIPLFFALVGVVFACDGKTPQADPALPDPPCGTRDGMVGLKRLDTGECFWMDARPVSQGEFFDAIEAGMTFADDSACTEHDAYAPILNPSRSQYCKGEMNLDTWAIHDGLQYLKWPPGSNTWHLPMNCASWCDAKAYCDFVGKRLCRAADVGRFEAIAAQADEIHAACATDVQPTGRIEGKGYCACWSSAIGECDMSVSPWQCTLNQCEGPYAGMHCMISNHLFVQADRPAMQSMGWRGEALDCTLGSVALETARQEDLDEANIVCCAD